MSAPDSEAAFKAMQAGSQIYYEVTNPANQTMRRFTSLMSAQRYADSCGGKVHTST